MNSDILSKLIITKIHSVSTIYTEENTKVKRVNRPCWAVLTKYEGETIYYTNRKTYVSNSDKMFILPKGSSYDWTCIKSGHYSIIEFESDMIYRDIFCFSVQNSEKLLRLFKELEYKSIYKNPTYDLESLRDLYSIILTLVQSEQKNYAPSQKQQMIAPALDFIAKNYSKKICNDDLASITGLSTVYFRKLFTATTGLSPIDYVHTYRIKKAKEMLLSDYSSITDISYSLGYINIYDFSRTFKKYTGLSPLNYLKERKNTLLPSQVE